MARPQEIPTEKFKEVCDLTLQINEDGSRIPIRKACETVGISTANFYQRCVSDQELAEYYAHTRKAQVLADNEEIMELEGEVKDGKISTEIAKVLIGSKQWRMTRLYRALFGDQQQVDINLTKTLDFSGLSREAYEELKAKILPQLPAPTHEE